MDQPYCFVLMPFGRKGDPAGGARIDFDAIYHDALEPAIRLAGMQPRRDDVTAQGGVVQKQLFEALLLCHYAIADLSLENFNVFYELGIRHAARPSSTLTVTGRPDSIPFDVQYLRSVRYQLDERNILTAAEAESFKHNVARELAELRENVVGRPTFMDSPLFQLVEGWRPVPPDSLKTDLFAVRVTYNDRLKQRLKSARAAAKRADDRAAAFADVQAVHAELGDLKNAEAGVLVDLLLTYRALERWDDMVALAEQMPGFLRERATVQEQMAFALNRRAGRSRASSERDRDRALDILHDLHEQKRSSAETFGLMGRIHKDRWRSAKDAEEKERHLADAIRVYKQGFRIDPRDPFPGINAATLMRVSGVAEDDPEYDQILSVVTYASERLLDIEQPTYWMYATLLEVAVLRNDPAQAARRLRDAVSSVRESWEPQTTADNLKLLVEEGVVSPEDSEWVEAVIGRLRKAASG